MTAKNNVILNHTEINHKIRRIAFQIYETNFDEEEVVLAGIDKNGYVFAKKLKTATNKSDAIAQAKEGKYSPGDIVTYTEDGKTYTGLWTGVTFL